MEKPFNDKDTRVVVGINNNHVQSYELHDQDIETESSVLQFPYTGIFTPGGFLSQVSEEPKENLEDIFGSKITLSTGNSESNSAIQSETDNNQLSASANHAEMGSSMFSVFLNSGLQNASDLPPAEGVFSIDHILEQIMAYIELSDLFNCRLVSRRWLRVSQTHLQKRLTLRFRSKTLIREKENKWWVRQGKTKSLKKFACLLETSQGFPCVKYEFNETSITDSDMQNFLISHGSSIEELTFSYQLSDKLPHEREVLLCVRNLLGCETPNLRVLRIGISCEVSWINNPERGEYDMLQTNDPELNEIRIECKGLKNSSLQTLEVFPPVNTKVLETIVGICTNLEEIDCDLFCFKEMCKLNPNNRIHLLKSLSVSAQDLSKCEEILFVCENIEINLQLRNFHLSFPLDEAIFLQNNAVIKKSVVKMANKILESCANSLEYINWASDPFLPGIKFPKEMPNVRHFEFRCTFLHNPSSAFLPGSDFSTIFPNLVSHKVFITGTWNQFPNFLLWLFSKPMPRVQSIHLDGVSMESVPTQLISSLFPNARVSELGRLSF